MNGVRDATLNASITAFEPCMNWLSLRPGTLGFKRFISSKLDGRILSPLWFYYYTNDSVIISLKETLTVTEGSLFYNLTLYFLPDFNYSVVIDS